MFLASTISKLFFLTSKVSTESLGKTTLASNNWAIGHSPTMPRSVLGHGEEVANNSIIIALEAKQPPGLWWFFQRFWSFNLGIRSSPFWTSWLMWNKVISYRVCTFFLVETRFHGFLFFFFLSFLSIYTDLTKQGKFRIFPLWLSFLSLEISFRLFKTQLLVQRT